MAQPKTLLQLSPFPCRLQRVKAISNARSFQLILFRENVNITARFFFFYSCFQFSSSTYCFQFSSSTYLPKWILLFIQKKTFLLLLFYCCFPLRLSVSRKPLGTQANDVHFALTWAKISINIACPLLFSRSIQFSSSAIFSLLFDLLFFFD